MYLAVFYRYSVCGRQMQLRARHRREWETSRVACVTIKEIVFGNFCALHIAVAQNAHARFGKVFWLVSRLDSRPGKSIGGRRGYTPAEICDNIFAQCLVLGSSPDQPISSSVVVIISGEITLSILHHNNHASRSVCCLRSFGRISRLPLRWYFLASHLRLLDKGVWGAPSQNWQSCPLCHSQNTCKMPLAGETVKDGVFHRETGKVPGGWYPVFKRNELAYYVPPHRAASIILSTVSRGIRLQNFEELNYLI